MPPPPTCQLPRDGSKIAVHPQAINTPIRGDAVPANSSPTPKPGSKVPHAPLGRLRREPVFTPPNAALPSHTRRGVLVFRPSLLQLLLLPFVAARRGGALGRIPDLSPETVVPRRAGDDGGRSSPNNLCLTPIPQLWVTFYS